MFTIKKQKSTAGLYLKRLDKHSLFSYSRGFGASKMKQRLVVFLVLLFFFFSIAALWFKEGAKPVNPQDKTPKIFVIKKGEGVREIAVRLKKEGLIRSPLAFFLLVRFSGIARDIEAGDFRLSPAMDAVSIAQDLTHGTLDVWLTTLEGWRAEEIALKLAQTLSIPEQEFLKVAQEGYMFPDTYLIPKEATAGAVAQIFYRNFARKFDESLKNETRRKGLEEKEVIILASIIEREAKYKKDRPVVAGILLKRYQKNWPLQADATIQYALGYQPEEKSWWKRGLTKEDLKVDSPYNSYKNIGLPPTPICNPGLLSIKAVIDPQETDYWYYLSDREGKMHYAQTFEEHSQNIARYLQ